jgi:glyoxylase-like metal-dependent hydrolase (beta-lactamase superfamily II)
LRINKLAEDIHLFIGDRYQANTTIFVAGNEALLVDALASDLDAQRLQSFVEDELKKEVRFIVSTHYFSDHIAALKRFPKATIVAQENYLDTYQMEQFRAPEEESFFVAPDILISDRIKLRWGRYVFDISHNPGHTSSTVTVDVPEADLLFVGDNLVGNIVYLRYSTPDRFVTALENLRRSPRTRLISSHGDVRSPASIEHATFYLDKLEQHAKEEDLSAPLEDYLPAGVPATSFEQIFHKRNLEDVVERRLFIN